MTQITFDYDNRTTVPIPIGSDDDGWMNVPLTHLSAAHELSDAETEVIQNALRLAGDDAEAAVGVRLGIFEPRTRTFSVLRILLIERQITQDERRDYLWPDSVLPPQVWMTPETAFGVGCSSMTVDDSGVGRGSIRWLFVPVGSTVVARLGPVSTRALMFMGVMAEEILATVRIDGVAQSQADDFRPAELIKRSDPDGRTWQQ